MTGKIFVISFILVVLFTSVVIAECPEKPNDCSDSEKASRVESGSQAEIFEVWSALSESQKFAGADRFPELVKDLGKPTEQNKYAQTANPNRVVAAWPHLEQSAQDKALARKEGEGLAIYQALDETTQSNLVVSFRIPNMVDVCRDCVSDFVNSDPPKITSHSDYVDFYQQTMQKFLISTSDIPNPIHENPEAAKKILELEANGKSVFSPDLLTNSDYNLKFDPPTLTGTDPATGEAVELNLGNDFGGAEIKSIQNNEFSQSDLPSDDDDDTDSTQTFPTSWQASIDDFKFNIRGGDGIQKNDNGSFTFTNNGDSIDITPNEPLDENQLIVSFEPTSEIYIDPETNVDITNEQTTFSTRPTLQFKDEIFSDPSLVKCELFNLFAQIYEQPEIICDNEEPVFKTEDYELLADIAERKTSMVAETKEQLGKDYLRRITETAQAGTPLNLNEEKNKLSDNTEATFVLNEIETFSKRNQYGKITLEDNGYTVENNLFIKNLNYIIIIHSGNVTKTPNMLEAEHATLFWNLKSYTDDYSVIESKNIVTGTWNASMVDDNITKVTLTASPQGYGQLRNYDADVQFKTYGTTQIDYLPEGEITYVQTKGPRISEIEYGEDLEFYQRGTIWSLFFSTDVFEADDFKEDFYQLRNGQSVLNTTLISGDSWMLYKPEKYKVGTYENASEKTVCYVGCGIRDSQIVVANDDSDLVSLGNLGNMSITYGANFLSAFDPHAIHLARTFGNELLGTFQTLQPKSSQDEEELLSRLDLEADMPMDRRESLKEHEELLYQQIEPSSFASFGTNLRFIHGPQTKLEFYSYRIDGQRKIVLNEYQYDNVLDISLEYENVPEIETSGILDDAVVYSIEDDLTMEPRVYGNIIRFENAETTREKFGKIT